MVLYFQWVISPSDSTFQFLFLVLQIDEAVPILGSIQFQSMLCEKGLV